MKITVRVEPPEHSMDLWQVWLDAQHGAAFYNIPFPPKETRAEAVRAAKIAISGVVKEFENL